jgi:hypothetical protein
VLTEVLIQLVPWLLGARPVHEQGDSQRSRKKCAAQAGSGPERAGRSIGRACADLFRNICADSSGPAELPRSW